MLHATEQGGWFQSLAYCSEEVRAVPFPTAPRVVAATKRPGATYNSSLSLDVGIPAIGLWGIEHAPALFAFSERVVMVEERSQSSRALNNPMWMQWVGKCAYGKKTQKGGYHVAVARGIYRGMQLRTLSRNICSTSARGIGERSQGPFSLCLPLM